MAFRPEINHTLSIDGVVHQFTEHPAAKGLPYGQSGRRATVFQLRAADGSLHALKVFTQTFRTRHTALGADRLRPFAALPGLQVCRRSVLAPERHSALLVQFPDLTYAVLMPWVSGETWQELVVGNRPLTAEQSLTLAQAFARILSTVEQRGLAHCDPSGPNVIVELSPKSVALVDVEDMFGPGLVRPEKLPGGSPGYAHRTAPQGLWSAEADRFGGAILLAEMLGWCDERVRRIAYGEQYFDPAEMQDNSERYQLLLIVLRERWGAAIANAFAQAWHSASLNECPTLGGWAELLGPIAPSSAPSLPAVGVADKSAGGASPHERLARGMLEKAEALLEIGQVEKALAELEEAYALAPEVVGDSYARALLREAHLAVQRGDLEAALAAYQIAANAARSTSLQNELQVIIAELEGEGDESESVATAADGLYCPNCGRDIQVGWVSCPYCAASLRQEESIIPTAQPDAQPALVEATTPASASASSIELDQPVRAAKSSSRVWQILGIGALAVTVVTVIAIANVFNQNAVGVGHASTQTAVQVAVIPSTTPLPTHTRVPPTAPSLPTQTPRPSATFSPTSTSIPASAILYSEDFEDGNTNEWKYYGDWTVVKDDAGDSVYEGTGPTDYPQVWLDTIGYEWTDYAFESRVRILKGGLFVLARATASANFYNAFLPSGGTISLAKYIKSQYSVYKETNYSIATGRWYLVRVEVQGGEYRLYINDELVTAYTHSGTSLLTHGSIGYYIGGGDKVQIDNVRVWALNSSSASPTATAAPRTRTRVPAPSATSVPASSTVNFSVSGTQGWQSTGVIINQGQRVRIAYGSGTWAGRVGFGPELPDIWTDARGIDFEIFYDEFGIKSRFASLIGKIGDGPVIQVGRSYDTVSEQAGTLLLRMFDIDMNDNDGSINVQITLWP